MKFASFSLASIEPHGITDYEKKKKINEGLITISLVSAEFPGVNTLFDYLRIQFSAENF